MAQQIKYIYNDPSTPKLIALLDIPPKAAVMPFKVDGFRGATDAFGTLEHQAACATVTITNAINLANKYLSIPVTRWATAPTLFVQPRAGKQLNAFYDRQALRFFYAADPVTKQLVYTSNSFDVVCHECGHAILDALRPDLFNVQAMEIWAYHESFADIHTIMNMLQHDLVLDVLLDETQGDLRQSNCVTKLAEEMGTTLYNMTGGRLGNQVGVLRNAFNTFTYKAPESLPKHGLDNQLTSEPHNFSRVFTGAWYDILVGMYDTLKTGLKPKEALIQARDTLCRYTYRSLRVAASTIRFYDSVARAMLVVDKANNYAYNNLMNNVFLSRGILRQTVRPMVSMDWLAFQPMVEPADEVLEDPAVVAVRSQHVELLPLPTHMVNVEAPADTYYEFNGTGECVNVITAGAEELVEHAHQCVEFLMDKGLIRPDKQTPFEIDMDGNLVRSHFACFNDNCKNPQAPEYRKCWKPKNNSGCGCNSKNHSQPENTTTENSGYTVVTQRLTR
jgi:hypothetical protein